MRIKDQTAFIRVGTKVGKAPILKTEQREGFDPSVYIAMDAQGNYYRTSETNTNASPDGWALVAVDANNKLKLVERGDQLPPGWRLIHGIAGLPLPPIAPKR